MIPISDTEIICVALLPYLSISSVLQLMKFSKCTVRVVVIRTCWPSESKLGAVFFKNKLRAVRDAVFH